MQVHGLAVEAGAVRPEAATAVAAQAAGPRRRRLPAELEDAAVLEEAARPVRAAGVEVQVGLEAVVDEPARGLAAGVADRLVHRGRGLGDEEEVAAGEQGVPQSVVLVGEGAGQVEIEADAPAAARVPGPLAGLLAAVAHERGAGGHQLEVV